MKHRPSGYVHLVLSVFVSAVLGPVVAATPLPFLFENNHGQAPTEIRYLARSGSVTHGVLDDGLVVAGPPSATTGARPRLRVRLSEATFASQPQGIEPLETRVRYYRGDQRDRWQPDVETFARLRFDEVYPGIAWELYGRGGQLEHDFVIAPGADPSAIRLTFDDIQPEVMADGSLRLGEFRQHPPVTYQPTSDGRRPVESRYSVQGDGVQFVLGAYDPALPLVIDPVLTYSTYLGGEGADSGHGVAVDGAGNAYVTGTSVTASFVLDDPIVANTDHAGGGLFDSFVAKIDPEGEQVVYLTFFGGSSQDLAQSVVVNPLGDAWIGGSTTSDDFPMLGSSLQPDLEGTRDAFIVRLDPDGSLAASTYLGGSESELVLRNSIARDGAGDIYLIGSTTSDDFPVQDPFQSDLMGDGSESDAFIAKVNDELDTVIYASYFGGERSECLTGCAVDVDAGGRAFLSGSTESEDLQPIDALQPTHGGGVDGFMALVSPLGDQLLYTSYFGGSNTEHPWDVTAGPEGLFHIVGETTSLDLELSANAVQPVFGGAWDAYLLRINPDLAADDQLVYSSFLGGSGQDRGFGVAVDQGGNSHLIGHTGSLDFPEVESLAGSPAPGNAFVGRIDPLGGLAFASHFGGDGADNGYSIAVDSLGSAWLTGPTTSENLPLAPDAPIQSNLAGGNDAYVARLTPDVIANPRFEYTAKILCGVQGNPEDTRLAMGGYSTIVNIHNPHRETVEFHKKLALAYPPGGQRPGDIIPIAIDRLEYDEALAVDCPDLVDRLGELPAEYIDGFIVIQSNHSLDVTTVYTTAALNEEGLPVHHSSIDVEQIAEREHPPGADLEIRKRAEVTPSDTITLDVAYTLEVENHGPEDATNVVVTDLLEAEVGALVNISNLAVSHGGAWVVGPLAADSVALVGTIPLLPAGNIATLEFTARATMDIATLSLRLVDTAHVTSEPGDPDLSNNSVQLVTTVP